MDSEHNGAQVFCCVLSTRTDLRPSKRSTLWLRNNHHQLSQQPISRQMDTSAVLIGKTDGYVALLLSPDDILLLAVAIWAVFLGCIPISSESLVFSLALGWSRTQQAKGGQQGLSRGAYILVLGIIDICWTLDSHFPQVM
ncbi:hypothetical protein BDZ97DRAFT_562000 [Flammula alnicola]|nr:hypothetical protein BDZ97DRAFT_562000 [Flammula alnicola]